MGLKYAPQAAGFLRSLSPTAKRRIRAALDLLDKDNRTAKLDIRALRVDQDLPAHYRVRVGDYRIAFRIVERRTEVVRIFHRRDGYGWLERLQ